MKKIIFIFLLLLLVGCTPTGTKLDGKGTIILNITSEVDPTIVSSSGEGVYDESTKTYTLNVTSSNPVDISLTHPDYETVSISITQTELLEGTVIRNIDFGKVPTATFVFKLYTKADLDSVSITDYEFTRENSTFTIKLPSRDINKTIIISADNCQPIEVDITPEKLIVGYYYDDYFLIGEDQALLTFILPENYIPLTLYDSVTKKPYSPYFNNRKLNYILDRGTNVFFDNPITDEYTYFNITENKVIDLDVLPGPNKNNYIIYNIDYSLLNNIYFENNGKRNKLIYDGDSGTYYTNIPIGSQILFEENDMLYYMDHIPSEKEIFFTLDDFGEAVLPELKFSVFDIVSNKYINTYTYMEEQFNAINNVHTSNYTTLIIDGYYVTKRDLLIQEKNENNEWFSYIEAAPSPEELVIDFVDSEGNPILNPNPNFHNIYFNGLFLQATGEIRVGSRYLYFDFFEYILNLDYEKVDGKNYYKSSTPITVDTDTYQVAVYSKINDYFLTVNGMNKAYDRYDDKVRIYSFKTNETIQIETKNTNMAYIYNLSREKLEKGILVLDENGQMLPDQIISVTFQTPENSSFNEIRLEFEYRPMPEVIYNIIYNDNKNIATIYYVYLPAKVFVEYVYNDVIYYELYPFNNSTNLIITNPK